jgi:MoxR-like ATPase
MSATTSHLESHLKLLLESLAAGLHERDQVIRLSLLGALAGENVLLLGPPGTAKSLIARRVASAFGADFFQYLLTRFTTPDELFGPVSLQALREEDTFRRKTTGYMPTAEVVFLDEIFKASSAILNSLLTLINEHIFFNGSTAEPVPMLALLAASNEVPQDDGLQALYDRFAIRMIVGPIQSDDAFIAMMAGGDATQELPEALRLDSRSVEMIRKAIRDIQLPKQVQRLILEIRSQIDTQAWLGDEAAEDPELIDRTYVSDRRWRQVMRLLRTSAYVNGRQAVNEVDCALLAHCLWNHPDDAAPVAALVRDALERSAVDFDLNLQPIIQRWTGLLIDMAGSKEVANPILTQDFVASWQDSPQQRLSLEQLEGVKKNDPKAVFQTGIAVCSVERSLRRIQRDSQGRLLRADRDTIDSLEELEEIMRLRQRVTYARPLSDDLQLLDGPVMIQQHREKGVRFTFGGLHRVIKQHWLDELSATRGGIQTVRAELESAFSRFDAEVSRHLFVDAEEVNGLRKGMVRARLLLDEWEKKTTDLQGAVEVGGQYVTTDVDYREPSTESPKDADQLKQEAMKALLGAALTVGAKALNKRAQAARKRRR